MASENIIDSIKEMIEDIFSLGPKGLIGIDIGLSAIKIAVVNKQSDGGYKVMNYSAVNLPEGTIGEDEIQKEDDFLKAMQVALKKLNSSNRIACVGLSGPNTLIKRVQVAGGSEDEIEEQAIWDTEQYLPFPVEDGNISCCTVGENQSGGIDVVVAAAKRSVVSSYKDILERAGLKVKIVDHNAAALLNVFEHVMGDVVIKKGTTWVLLDLGAQKTNFIIYKNGLLVFYKEINVGGLTVTEEIQRQLGVNYNEAESLKIYGDGNGNIPEEIVVIANQVSEILFSEIKKTIDFWSSTSSDETYDGCVITGGGAQAPGMQEALQEIFETEVQLLNPFKVMSHNNNNISDENINEIISRGVCSIGLAMRSIAK